MLTEAIHQNAEAVPESRAHSGGLSRAVPAGLPVVVVGLALVVDVATLVVVGVGWSEHVPLGYGAGIPALLATALYGVVAAVVGLTLAVRRPSNVIGLLLCATALGEATHMLAMYGAAMGVARGFGWATSAAWLSGNLLQPTAGLMIPFLMLVFPDGRLASRPWRAAVVVVVVGASLRFAETAFASGPIPYFPTVPNPAGLSGDLGRAAAVVRSLDVGLWILATGFALAVASLVARYRDASLEGRRQIRWFVLAGAVVAATIVPLMYLFLDVDQGAGTGEQVWVAFFLASALIPLAVAIAITRHRLYEIDRIVNRTILYGILTALLAGLFTAGIAFAQRLFVLLTGQRSDGAIVLTTFAVATAYAPLRRSLEGIVDRRFRYDGPRFGMFRDDVLRVLEVVDPISAGRRLCREAVTELDLVGAALISQPDRVLATEGAPVDDGVRIDLGEGLSLLLGPRRDGNVHATAAVADLMEVAALLSRAAESFVNRRETTET